MATVKLHNKIDFSNLIDMLWFINYILEAYSVGQRGWKTSAAVRVLV